MENYKSNEIKGVIPALITSFDKEENLDEKRMRETVRFLLQFPIGGLYLTGSTGEAFLMTADERRRVVETVVDEVNGKIPLIVHVGSISTKISEELAIHAQAAGADAIASVPPFYFNFRNENVYHYYEDIANSVDIPMFIYNIPLAGAVGFDMIKRLSQISGVKGIKYTLPTHYEIVRMKNEIGKDFAIYSGVDEMAASGVGFGADGIIGSFYNIIPDLFLEIFNAASSGDMKTAIEKQDIANKVIFTALEYDCISLIKTMMSWCGIDAGYSRRPFNNYTGLEEAKIKERFREIKKDNDIKGIQFFDSL